MRLTRDSRVRFPAGGELSCQTGTARPRAGSSSPAVRSGPPAEILIGSGVADSVFVPAGRDPFPLRPRLPRLRPGSAPLSSSQGHGRSPRSWASSGQSVHPWCRRSRWSERRHLRACKATALGQVGAGEVGVPAPRHPSCTPPPAALPQSARQGRRCSAPKQPIHRECLSRLLPQPG